MTRIIAREERTVTEDVVAEVRCDLCGVTLRPRRDLPPGWVNWNPHSYTVDEVVIRRTHGERYDEGDFTEHTFFDICGECFEGKVIPALQALGAQPIKESESLRQMARCSRTVR